MFVTTSVHASSGHKNVRACSVMLLYHVYYINPDVSCHFLIDGYVITSYLRFTISFPWTMSVYDVLLSVYYTSVSTLDLIPSLFDPILTTFGTPSCITYTTTVTMVTIDLELTVLTNHELICITCSNMVSVSSNKCFIV